MVLVTVNVLLSNFTKGCDSSIHFALADHALSFSVSAIKSNSGRKTIWEKNQCHKFNTKFLSILKCRETTNW